MNRFEIHAHTMYSNIRLLDSINKPEDLINRAIKLGLSGICITDHDCISSHVKVNQIAKKLRETHPDFKIGLGNEIYLCDTRDKGQKYYHFILVAKNKKGHVAISELSSDAWLNIFEDRRLERVVTTKDKLREIVSKYPGSLVASTACFREGAKVLTLDGEKPIETVTSKDYILNMYGKWERVNFPTSRNYKGKGYKITFFEDSTPIVCTEDHKFLVTTNNKIQGYKERGTNPLEWVEAKNLNIEKGGRKDICLLPISKIIYHGNDILERVEWENKLLDETHIRRKKIRSEIKITPEVMRLFGLFLGDGWISINKDNNYYCVGFTFNIEEFGYYWDSFVKKASEDIGIDWSRNIQEEQHKVGLTSHCIDLVELFFYLFGNVKGGTKTVPKRLKNIRKDLDFELAFGYMLADGYFRTRVNKNKKIESGEMVTASISKQLSYDIHNLLSNMGIRNSIYFSKERIDKDNAKHRDSWYITSSNNAWKDVSKKTLITHNDVIFIFNTAIKHCSNKYIKIDGVYYKKVYIKNKEEIDLDETVYCLNVNSHSFVCNNVVVHNCLGGQLATLVSNLVKYEEVEQEDLNQETREEIDEFLSYCLDLFGEDFYIEVAPGLSKEQVIFNNRVKEFAENYRIKIIVGTDAHYLKKEDRWIHKAYLTSKQGEREVDDFYEYAYLMSDEEVRNNLPMFDYDELIKNSLEIYDKIEFYDLFKKQIIPKEKVRDYPKVEGYKEYPTINKLLKSDDAQERYWVNQCLEGLKRYNKLNKEYLERIETEADVMNYLSQNLEDCLFAYPNTIQHYIDLFWRCGSIVGPGRGSAVGFLSNYLLGITQIDPVESELPYWRFLNKSRVELPKLNRYWAVVNKECEPCPRVLVESIY